MSMFDQLAAVEQRFESVEAELGSPGLGSDPARLQALMKEHSNLKEVVEVYRGWRGLQSELADARELQSDQDPDVQEMAKEEIATLDPRIEAAATRLKILLLPKDPHEGRDVILEIRAGVGGNEAGLWAADLFRMYSRYGEARRWSFELMSVSHNDSGGYKEVIAQVKGPDVYKRLKYESGVHRVQRVPATEAQGRIHTSTATVALMPEADPVEVHIEDKDLRIDVFRASGPGGQSVNTTDSAVRITHLPTSTVVICQDEKSQHKNKAKAMTVLRTRVYEKERAIIDAESAALRRDQVGTGDRSERIRTYNFAQGRITDHRIGVTLYTLDKVLQGDLDDLLDHCATRFEAKALEQLDDE